MAKKFVVWFFDVDHEDIGIVGGKGANLGEMTKAHFPVPPGFIVTASAYFHFLDEADIRDKIYNLVNDLDVADSKSLDRVALGVQKLITRSKFPPQIASDIIKAYFTLEKGLMRHANVAVRSSATAEDLPSASFAGQQSTFLNVHGEANLIENIKDAWASLFTARAIFYRTTNHFDHFKVGIAVIVQQMVASEKSGIMFTIDPVTNDKKKIVIEAIYGLGELIVGGTITPDHYEVDKTTGHITKNVTTQEKMLIYQHGKNIIVPVQKPLRQRQKLTDSQITTIAQLGKKLEHHYYFPQDAEWAIEKDKIYLVQTRPVTTIGKEIKNLKLEIDNSRVLLVRGDPASPGIASGPVKIISSPKEIYKINSGDVMVAQMTNPDYVPAMKKAVAIVTEHGGRTSHAAIVSRELGIPAVVGAKDAKKILKDGQIITVNGATGEVFKGAIVNRQSQIVNRQQKTENLKTATHVYVNMAEPDRASSIAVKNVDGVGLLRAEFMIAAIGTHPKQFIAEKRQNIFIKELADGIQTIASAFNPRPVVYRATDFRTNEYRNLKGGSKFEPHEENPMLGFRGAARYISDPRVFELELEAIKLVRNKKNLKNVHLMIPFVRTPTEILEVKKIVSASGLTRGATFKLWMMVEVPTNVILIEDYIDVGIDGVSIGSNDLTMLTLGVDRDNSELAPHYTELDPAVLWSLQRVIKACAKRGVTSSICGQAPSDYPDLVEKLVNWGITSLSVNVDAIDLVRETVLEAEKKVIAKK